VRLNGLFHKERETYYNDVGYSDMGNPDYYDRRPHRYESRDSLSFGSRCNLAPSRPTLRSKPSYSEMYRTEKFYDLQCLKRYKVTVRAINRDSRYPECVGLAKKWVETCLKSHPLCRKLSEPPLPTRVFDVGNGQPRDPFLFVSNGLRGSYACLSHCWGTAKP
jgi:hypothetical protein